ncbi:MAG: carbohydrate-binding family 9-like protein [Clostridia bacterium]|nr:carbohydrate-binding family 9-like protein [Clostridia bacterium]
MIAYLKDNVTGEQSPISTILHYFRIGNNLHFKFICEDSKLFSAYSGYNEPIYKGDVCEVFLCTGEDIREYYEIEVAPNGASFFAKILNDNGLRVNFLEKSFESKVEITEKGYNVEITVPCEAIGVKDGVQIRFNAFRIETDGGVPERHLLALSPTLTASFHVPERFILFETI